MRSALYPAYQGSCVWVSARTGELITKSSKLLWIELNTGMYSPLWTPIPQASISSLYLLDMAVFKVAEVERVRIFAPVVATLNTKFL